MGCGSFLEVTPLGFAAPRLREIRLHHAHHNLKTMNDLPASPSLRLATLRCDVAALGLELETERTDHPALAVLAQVDDLLGIAGQELAHDEEREHHKRIREAALARQRRLAGAP